MKASGLTPLSLAKNRQKLFQFLSFFKEKTKQIPTVLSDCELTSAPRVRIQNSWQSDSNKQDYCSCQYPYDIAYRNFLIQRRICKKANRKIVN